MEFYIKRMSIYLLDEFVNTKIGTPYRLFPFGKIVKNGKVREITPESAAQFKLPHFKPAIKLGSHDEPTPAGGHIVGLEVRDDGLYALPEWNDRGETAVNDGAYRYHSPEVLWGDGALEDPKTGDFIEGPMIIGDALLHTPHLGEDAALYSAEIITKGVQTMTVENTVEVPQKFWDKLTAIFDQSPREPQQPEPVKVTETDEFKAVAVERDNFRAQLDALKAEKEKADLLNSITAELQDKEKFGSMYVELKGAQEAAEVMAGMTMEQREWCMRNFKALIAQSKLGANIEQELGTEGQIPSGGDPVAAFDAEIRRVQAENKIEYAAAARKVATDKPELYEAYKQAKEK